MKTITMKFKIKDEADMDILPEFAKTELEDMMEYVRKIGGDEVAVTYDIQSWNDMTKLYE